MNYLDEVIKKRVELVIKNLNKNNMSGYFVQSKKDLTLLLDTIVKDGSTVSVGGSMTLFETETIEYLRNKKEAFYEI